MEKYFFPTEKLMLYNLYHLSIVLSSIWASYYSQRNASKHNPSRPTHVSTYIIDIDKIFILYYLLTVTVDLPQEC